MDMFEEARAMDVALRMIGVTQETLAKKFGVSQSYVANKIRLLKFSPEMQALLRETGLSERHARAFLRLSGEEARGAAILRAAREKLTVAETEEMVDGLLLTEEKKSKDETEKLALSRVSSGLSDAVRILSSVGIDAAKTVEEDGSCLRFTLTVRKAG